MCRPRLNRRAALTLIELLMASTVMVLIAGTMAGLATTVLTGNDYAEGQALAAQHAQITLDRIGRTVREAAANANFPGVLVLESPQVGLYKYPDTLVVWRPEDAQGRRIEPMDPAGWPRWKELVIFCPHPGNPAEPASASAYLNRMVEIRNASNDTSQFRTDVAGWEAQVASMKTAAFAAKRIVTLTDLVRVAPANGSTALADRRAAVRFVRRVSTLAAAGMVGQGQVWLRTELQLRPGPNASAGEAIPFLDSAALYYKLP